MESGPWSCSSSIYGIRSMVMFKQHEWNQVHGHVHVQGSNSKDSRALEKIDGLCKLRANEIMIKENFMEIMQTVSVIFVPSSHVDVML